jgi:hypothetical protein
LLHQEVRPQSFPTPRKSESKERKNNGAMAGNEKDPKTSAMTRTNTETPKILHKKVD